MKEFTIFLDQRDQHQNVFSHMSLEEIELINGQTVIVIGLDNGLCIFGECQEHFKQSASLKFIFIAKFFHFLLHFPPVLLIQNQRWAKLLPYYESSQWHPTRSTKKEPISPLPSVNSCFDDTHFIFMNNFWKTFCMDALKIFFAPKSKLIF